VCRTQVKKKSHHKKRLGAKKEEKTAQATIKALEGGGKKGREEKRGKFWRESILEWMTMGNRGWGREVGFDRNELRMWERRESIHTGLGG